LRSKKTIWTRIGNKTKSAHQFVNVERMAIGEELGLGTLAIGSRNPGKRV